MTSDREPAGWLSMVSEALLARSAVCRLSCGLHKLVSKGPSTGSVVTGEPLFDYQDEAK